MLPGNSCEPYVSTSNAQFGVPLETSDTSQAQPLHEQMMMNDDPNPRGFDLFFGFDDFNDPNALNMYGRQFPGPEPGSGLMDTIPEYDIPEPSVNGHRISQSHGDASSLQHRSGAEEVPYTIPYPPGNGDLPMPPSADFFHPNETQYDRYPLRTWGNSAGRPLDGDHRHPGVDAAIAASDSHLPYRSAEHAYYQPGVTLSPLHQQPVRPPPVSSAGREILTLANIDTAAREILKDVHMTNGATSPSAKEPGLRRDSTMSRLVESIDNVEVKPHALENKASQQSIGHPSLAQRRQRRPAPLGPLGGRSTSHSLTTPASPKSAQPQSSERQLRRARSSIGVMNGRVQKPGFSVSAQRSPLSLTFSESTASSKLSKSLSSRSMTSLSVETLSRTNSLVPITPVSPPAEEEDSKEDTTAKVSCHMGHDSGFSMDDSVWANMPNTSDTTTGSVWSSHVPLSATTDHFEKYASPPETPLQPQQASSVPYPPQHGQFSMPPSNTPYGSHWQHSFQVTPRSHQYTPMQSATMNFQLHPTAHQAEEQMQTNVPQHRRQGSNSKRGNVPEFNSDPNVSAVHNHALSYEATNAPGIHQYQLVAQQYAPQHHPQHQEQYHQQYSAMHQSSESQPQSQRTLSSPQQQLTHPHKLSQTPVQYVFHMGDSDMANVDSTDSHSTVSQGTASPTRVSQSQELMIQQFSPREPVDPSRLPPKMKLNEPPKHFEFQTCGPESFSSP